MITLNDASYIFYRFSKMQVYVETWYSSSSITYLISFHVEDVLQYSSFILKFHDFPLPLHVIISSLMSVRSDPVLHGRYLTPFNIGREVKAHRYQPAFLTSCRQFKHKPIRSIC